MGSRLVGRECGFAERFRLDKSDLDDIKMHMDNKYGDWVRHGDYEVLRGIRSDECAMHIGVLQQRDRYREALKDAVLKIEGLEKKIGLDE